MYSTPAVERVLFPTKGSPEENLCVSSCFTTVPWGTGGTRTRTILRSQSPDVLQQSVGMLFQMTDEVVEPETYGALPLRYGAKFSSRAGGTRTHNPRVMSHVLQSGSRSCFGGDEVVGQRHFRTGIEPANRFAVARRTGRSRCTPSRQSLCFKRPTKGSPRCPLLSVALASDSGHTPDHLGEMLCVHAPWIAPGSLP